MALGVVVHVELAPEREGDRGPKARTANCATCAAELALRVATDGAHDPHRSSPRSPRWRSGSATRSAGAAYGPARRRAGSADGQPTEREGAGGRGDAPLRGRGERSAKSRGNREDAYGASGAALKRWKLSRRGRGKHGVWPRGACLLACRPSPDRTSAKMRWASPAVQHAHGDRARGRPLRDRRAVARRFTVGADNRAERHARGSRRPHGAIGEAGPLPTEETVRVLCWPGRAS